MKKILLRLAGALLAVLVLVVGLEMIAAESGEVVVLTTRDAAGERHETRLWVVDHEGRPWLRAGADVQAWYQRLVANPQVEVERDGTAAPYTAVPAPTAREPINARMRDEYGWADAYISLLFGREDSVPIRLDEAPPRT